VVVWNFTPDEALLIYEALNLVWLEDQLDDGLSRIVVLSEVHRKVTSHADHSKWAVDGPVLMGKLKALQPDQVRTLVQAVRQAWEYADLTTDQKLRKAGLLS
jgi:hypothetical protein